MDGSYVMNIDLIEDANGDFHVGMLVCLLKDLMSLVFLTYSFGTLICLHTLD